MEKNIFPKLNHMPKEDTVFWPVYLLDQLDNDITYREGLERNSVGISAAILKRRKRYFSLLDTVRKVKRAYEILAYPHCDYEGWQLSIQIDLETDRQLYGRDQIELNDEEFRVLSKITAATKIPFNPQKRIYSYWEVPISLDIYPFGLRHTSTNKISKCRR